MIANLRDRSSTIDYPLIFSSRANNVVFLKATALHWKANNLTFCVTENIYLRHRHQIKPNFNSSNGSLCALNVIMNSAFIPCHRKETKMTNTKIPLRLCGS